MSTATFPEIAKVMREKRSFAVLSHVRPDGDALGSQLAVALTLKKLGKDVRVWNEGTGVYLEHFVRSSIFRRLQAGPNVTRGLTCEWADPGWGSQPACVGNVIDESFFDTDAIGVYLDEGTVGTTVRNSIFAGQCWAAIVNYKGVNNLYDTTGNDYSRLRAGAVPVSNDHDRLLPNCRGAALG